MDATYNLNGGFNSTIQDLRKQRNPRFFAIFIDLLYIDGNYNNFHIY